MTLWLYSEDKVIQGRESSKIDGHEGLGHTHVTEGVSIVRDEGGDELSQRHCGQTRALWGDRQR